MKAIHIPSFHEGDIATLQVSEISSPVPKDNEFCIRITHCSPQHADILHAEGKHQNNTKRGWCHPPFTLGYDFAGEIKSCPGQSRTRSLLKKGDRVFGAHIGAFSE